MFLDLRNEELVLFYFVSLHSVCKVTILISDIERKIYFSFYILLNLIRNSFRKPRYKIFGDAKVLSPDAMKVVNWATKIFPPISAMSGNY